MVKMVGSGERYGLRKNQFYILRLVLLILCLLVIVAFKLIVGLRPKLPKLKLVQLNHLNHILLIILLINFLLQLLSSSSPKSATSSNGTSQNNLYAYATLPEYEAFSDIITGMLDLFSRDVYYLLNLGSTLYYITLYVEVNFGFVLKCISNPFFVSTLVGVFIVDRKVYKGCLVSICDKETLVDLIKLDMVDFDLALVIDWLNLCCASLYCRTQRVSFRFPTESVIEWEGSSVIPKG